MWQLFSICQVFCRMSEFKPVAVAQRGGVLPLSYSPYLMMFSYCFPARRTRAAASASVLPHSDADPHERDAAAFWFDLCSWLQACCYSSLEVNLQRTKIELNYTAGGTNQHKFIYTVDSDTNYTYI